MMPTSGFKKLMRMSKVTVSRQLETAVAENHDLSNGPKDFSARNELVRHTQDIDAHNNVPSTSSSSTSKVMTDNRKSFCVIEFIELPYKYEKYIYIPNSWITITYGMLVLVAYPIEDPINTKERVKRNEKHKEKWKTFLAIVKHRTVNLNDAIAWALAMNDHDRREKKNQAITETVNSSYNGPQNNTGTKSDVVSIANEGSDTDTRGDQLTSAVERRPYCVVQGTPSGRMVNSIDMKLKEFTCKQNNSMEDPFKQRGLDYSTKCDKKRTEPVDEDNFSHDAGERTLYGGTSNKPNNYNQQASIHSSTMNTPFGVSNPSTSGNQTVQHFEHIEDQPLTRRNFAHQDLQEKSLKIPIIDDHDHSPQYVLVYTSHDAQNSSKPLNCSSSCKFSHRKQVSSLVQDYSGQGLRTNAEKVIDENDSKNCLSPYTQVLPDEGDIIPNRTDRSAQFETYNRNRQPAVKTSHCMESQSLPSSTEEQHSPICLDTSDTDSDDISVKGYQEHQDRKVTHSEYKTQILPNEVNLSPAVTAIADPTYIYELETLLETINSYDENSQYNNDIGNNEIIKTEMNGSSASTSTDVNQQIKQEEVKEDDEEEGGNEENNDFNDTVKNSRVTMGRIRFILPPEYDPHDTRWTLKYKEPLRVTDELIPNSRVFVDAARLRHCKCVAKTCTSMARMLLTEIFSVNALSVCTWVGKDLRPGLDKNARDALLTYVEKHGIENGWNVDIESIKSSLQHKIFELRSSICLQQ